MPEHGPGGRVFSKSHRYGYKEDVKTWGQLGLTGEWANRPVSLYGRNSASGTYGFFKEHALKNGDFKDEVKEQPGSASVVQGVTVDRLTRRLITLGGVAIIASILAILVVIVVEVCTLFKPPPASLVRSIATGIASPPFAVGVDEYREIAYLVTGAGVQFVSAEDSVSNVPQHLVAASLALGATKFETTVRVVLPSVMPSILTGLILAMARAAGEVAPLMITGVVKLAPALPIDGIWPFLHPEWKVMHLGFHIYDVAFQSPNVDAVRPMVFMTAMLLLIVVTLNLTAISLRNRLRKRYASSAL